MRGLSRRVEVDFPVVENRNACRALCFKLIQNAIVAVAQGWKNDLCESVAVLAYEVNACFESGFLRPMKHCRRHGSAGRVGLIKPVQKEEIAEMKNACIASRKIKVRGIQKGIRTPLVKKG